MTFVKVKLALETLEPGDSLEVLLTEGEPLNNVPKSAADMGFEVSTIEHVDASVHRVVISKPCV